MTELEALKAMADAAEYVLSYPGTFKLIAGHTPEQLKEAHGQVVDLIKRVEEAQNKPSMVQQMAEEALAEIGLVVPTVIGAQEVREWLREFGQKQLALDLSDGAICAQIEVLLGDCDIHDVTGVPEWQNDIAHLAAENLCKAAGVAYLP